MNTNETIECSREKAPDVLLSNLDRYARTNQAADIMLLFDDSQNG